MVQTVTQDDIGIKVLRKAPSNTTQSASGIDIVAVHGIGAHPDDTWRKHVGTMENPQTVNWLEAENMLPAAVPNARIMRYGYESSWFGEEAIRQRTSTVAQRLLLALKRERKECPFRPIIFIAHCFGGLVVLKALLEARYNPDEWPNILLSTTGLLFFGTPFRGASGMSQMEMIEAARREYEDDDVQADILNILQPGNEFLQELVDQFGKTRKETNKPAVACFFELKHSNVGKIVGKQDRKKFVVDEGSGCLDLSDSMSKFSLSRNHFDMNKFGKPTEEDFRTLSDVIEEMVARSPDLIAARSKSQSRIAEHYYVPHISVSKFFGRHDIISKLRAFLLEPRGPNDKPNAAVLQALGGQGKSQIALELCRMFKKHFRGVFWLDATSKATIERGFEKVAAKLNQPVASSLQDTELKVRLVLDTLEGWEDQWLLVYDNYDRPDLFPEIRQFLPENGHGCILITSRHEATKTLGRHFQVPSMINDGGVELLLRHMPKEEIENVREDATAIVSRLGGLALAIEQAAAYMSFNHITLPDFIDQYEKKKKKVLQHIPEDLWEYQKQSNSSEHYEALSAFTTWEMSCDQIEKTDETRKSQIMHFLSLVAFLEPSHIGAYLFETYVRKEIQPFSWFKVFMCSKGSSDEEDDSDSDHTVNPSRHTGLKWSEDRFWETVKRLHHLSLVQSIERTPIIWFSIHPVISDWLQLRERRKSVKEKSLQEAITLMSVVLSCSSALTATPPRTRELLAHMDCCLTNSRHPNTAVRLGCTTMRRETMSFAKFFDRQRLYARSLELYESLFDEEKECLNKSDRGHRDLLRLKFKLAQTYLSLNQVDSAEKLAVQVTMALKETVGAEHLSTLQSMGFLAETYSAQGRLDVAERLMLEAMEGLKEMLGADHIITLGTMESLATHYRRRRHWLRAEELGLQAVEGFKKKLGFENSKTVRSMADLAIAYNGMGRFDEAEQIQLQVLETLKKMRGIGHRDTLATMKNLALTWKRQGRKEEAIHLMQECVQIRGQSLGVNHGDTIKSSKVLSRWVGLESE